MSKLELHGVVDELTPDKEKYASSLKILGEAFTDAYTIFNDPEYQCKKDWKVEIDRDDVKIHSKHYPFGNVFALKAKLPAPIDVAFDESYIRFADLEKWNSNIFLSKIHVRLTEHVDIIHYANPDIMIVKSRDYVAGRLWRKINDEIFVAARSIKIDEIPETKEHVRAKVHLGCGRFTPDSADPNATYVEYILSLDLKGMIPKSVVNAVMGRMMVKDFEETLKRYQDIMAARK